MSATSLPPLRQGLALVVPGRLQVPLQTLLLRLKSLGVIGLQPLAGVDVLQLLQQLLFLIDEDESVSLRVKQPWPRLAVQLGDLNLNGSDPKEEEKEVEMKRKKKRKRRMKRIRWRWIRRYNRRKKTKKNISRGER